MLLRARINPQSYVRICVFLHMSLYLETLQIRTLTTFARSQIPRSHRSNSYLLTRLDVHVFTPGEGEGQEEEEEEEEGKEETSCARACVHAYVSTQVPVYVYADPCFQFSLFVFTNGARARFVSFRVYLYVWMDV